MKARIILILSFLLFSYSISAEEKNGTTTEQVRNSEIKVLEEQIRRNKNQIKALKDELVLSSKPIEKWYLFGAVLLGALLGFFTAEASAWRRRREEQKEEQKILTNSIVIDCLKFHLKTEEKMLRIVVLKRRLLNLKKTKDAKASELQCEFSQTMSVELMNDFPAEIKFYTYQLTRLEDREIKDEGAELLELIDVLIQRFLESDNLDEVEKAYAEYKELLTKFTHHCMEITEVKS